MLFLAGKQTLIDFPQLLILGAFAGLTIFLGLPLAVIQRVSLKMKGFLNAVAIGILIFLTVDVFSHAWESTADAARTALAGTSSIGDAGLALLAMFGGIAIGLLGLTWHGTRYMKSSSVQLPIIGTSTSGSSSVVSQQELQLFQQADAYKLSMMIAVGIG